MPSRSPRLLLLAALCLALGCSWTRRRSGAPRSRPTVQLRELGQPTDPALDRAVELSLRDGPGAAAAALFVFDEQGRSLAAPIAFVSSAAGVMRVVVARRTLDPYLGRAMGVVAFGSEAFVRAIVERQARRTRAELAVTVGDRALPITLDAASLGAPFDEATLASAEGLITVDPASALALIDGLRGSAVGEAAPRADAIAAEAAFAFGRARLALRFAERGLSLVTAAQADVRLEARLRRIVVLVDIEESVSKETPASRERLAATAEKRADPLEIALDAALDVRLAEVHDRTFPLDRRAPAIARVFVEAMGKVEGDRGRLASGLCRAARHLADGTATDPAPALLAQGAAVAHAAHRLTDEVICAIKAGDVARAFGRFEAATAHFEHARELLGDRPLPREQREAAFSAALLADARGDHAEALRAALVACRFIDRLLASESDLAAREALVSFVVGYYGVTELFAVRAGDPTLAIIIGESGKARAFGVLLAGPAGVDATAGGAWVGHRALAVEEDVTKVAATRALLGEADAALSFMQVGTDERGFLQHAVGVITREAVSVRITTHSATFLADVVAHGEAIEQGDEPRARVLGARIYDELLRPTEDLWAGKNRLFLSPNRRLQSLSWAALHDGKRYLVERAALARVPPFFSDPRLAADDSVRLRPARWLFALDPQHPPFEQLPGLRALGTQLASVVAPRVILQGEEVTASRLLREAKSVDALLYAGHAEYRPERPLESALLVAKSASDREGKVFAWSALGMERPPKLVLLVGCETARLWKGTASFSDDFIGLPRAFLAAGARYVVGALWPVVDRDAEEFLRAVFAVTDDVDPIRAIGKAQACMASGTCVSRGIASWASYVVDAR